MTDEKKHVDSVKALMNGSEYTIAIQRHALPYFEADHGSAISMLKRLMGNSWTAKDVTDVLDFAMCRQPAEGTNLMQWQMQKQFTKVDGVLVAFTETVRSTAVREAVRAHGVGTYAPLASMVLLAALYGIDEADASFSDEEENADG
ncbi:hypothetical protein N7376_24195 [Brucella intermedia GD04153]|uniref:Uncharacterized protein n=1 Tax=Brucella intermedia GD04153 TaxID=2975438 RepID=A0AA42KMM2_9HYPH|nr:hypothetical protein [Brucella intermedia]MDH0127073.1 hypothetical protein [Brucella intermedia GD04153]